MTFRLMLIELGEPRPFGDQAIMAHPDVDGMLLRLDIFRPYCRRRGRLHQGLVRSGAIQGTQRGERNGAHPTWPICLVISRTCIVSKGAVARSAISMKPRNVRRAPANSKSS